MRILEELKRRRVFRVALGYLVVAWLVIQVAGQLIQLLELPVWIGKTIVLLLALGLPVALILAWAYDVTPDGIERTDARPTSGPIQPRPRTLWRVGWAALIVLLACAGAWALASRADDAADVDDSVVAVAPFRVSAADDSYGYLREGMIDLLAAKLTGEGGPRAADPRAVLAAWRDAGIRPEDDLAVEPALAAARSIGAGLLLRGDVVGSPTHVTITATIARVPDGDVVATASAEGTPDALPSVVDDLAARLLAQLDESDPERLRLLAETDLPALRVYLDAQRAHRAGRFEHALDLYKQAVRIDSTFALAALGWVVAAEWDPFQWPEAIAAAWPLRDRLSDRDREVLLSYSGERWPDLPTDAELLVATERALMRITDRAELHSHLGELLIHAAPTRENHRERARAAFERAVALDSGYLSAYPHLIEFAAMEGDTAGLRRLARPYFEADSTEALSYYLQWLVARVEGDSVTADSIVELLPVADPIAAARIVGIAQLHAIRLDDAERAVGFLRAHATDPQQGRFLQSYYVNRGRIADASSIEIGGPPGEHSLVLNAMYSDGDSARTERALANMRARIAAPVETDPLRRRPQIASRFLIAQWDAWRGETAGIAEAVQALRSQEGQRAVGAGRAQLHAALLEAIAATVRNQPDAAQKIATLEATMDTARDLDGTTAWDSALPSIVAARLHDMRGDQRAALRALRHRYYHFIATDFLSAKLREEGRLCSALGDRECAIRAYRHYLELRDDPDPSLRPQVEQVRAELARLAGEPRAR